MQNKIVLVFEITLALLYFRFVANTILVQVTAEPRPQYNPEAFNPF